jgi:hypothetical protein
MTIDLDAIEARAKTVRAEWPSGPNAGQIDPGALAADVLALVPVLRLITARNEGLVARCHDLEMSLDQWQGSHENEVAKRERAEARVKVLEAELAVLRGPQT